MKKQISSPKSTQNLQVDPPSSSPLPYKIFCFGEEVEVKTTLQNGKTILRPSNSITGSPIDSDWTLVSDKVVQHSTNGDTETAYKLKSNTRGGRGGIMTILETTTVLTGPDKGKVYPPKRVAFFSYL